MFRFITDRVSLTLSMLILTMTVGAGVWYVTDLYQSNLLSTDLTRQLRQQFNEDALQQRIRFDQYVKSYNPGVRLYAKNSQLKYYVQNAHWVKGQSGLVKYQDVPQWAPSIPSMRQFVMPRYMLLIDKWGKVREIYHYRYPLPPKELIEVSPLVLELSIGQSYLTFFGGKLYLIASEHVSDMDGKEEAVLMIASPVDRQFMIDSQGVFQSSSIIGLVRDDDNLVYVSSAPETIASGTDIQSLNRDYLVTEASFFDSGSADIIIRFFSLTSTKALQQQIDKLMAIDRKVSMTSSIIFITSFSLIMLWITAKIRGLSKKVVSFSNDIKLPVSDVSYNNELRELDNRFRLLANAVQTEKSALEHQAMHDSLTDIPNRSCFDITLNRAITHGDRGADRFALLVCDLNKFKQVNDNYGHQVGDEVIRIASRRLVSCLRENDFVARMGGDEFAVILKDVGHDEVAIVANKIINYFKKAATVDGHRHDVGISIGAALYPRDGDDADTLMKHADIAMYRAKQGDTSFAFYNSRLMQSASRHLH
jgi:diguanylate cyclase (GGDEF)-like protein